MTAPALTKHLSARPVSARRPDPPSGAALLPDAVLRPVREGHAFEATVEQLATAIRLGVFRDGELLPPERDLAARLGVSRSTLRDAIAALRAAGMVTTRRGRGGGSAVAYRQDGGPDGRDGSDSVGAVPHPRADLVATLGDTLAFRRVVEPGAARLAAAAELTADQAAWLRAAEREARQHGSVGTDLSARRVADSRLHLAIATLSGSAMLVEAVTRVQAVVHEMLRAIPALQVNLEHSDAEHERIVEAVLAGDPETARLAMERHCDGTSALLRGLLR